MSWGFVAVAGATVVSGAMQSDAQSSAARSQERAGQASIEEQRRQFDAMQELLSPYAEGGEEALQAQRALLGLAGEEEQQAAISNLADSPAFRAALEQGEEGILQNAAATGGLRGGNVQAALGQFRPALLADTIQRQFSNLGGLTQMGQASAAGVGSAGIQTGQSIGRTLTDIGSSQAASRLAQGQTQANMISNLAGLFAGGRERGVF